jgi:Domain of unknown function (DUF4145)
MRDNTLARKSAPPSLGADSFSCPHCGALAHQTWHRILGEEFYNEYPSMPDPDLIDRIELHEEIPLEHKTNWIKDIRRQLTKEVYWGELTQPHYVKSLLTNVTVSQCYSCKRLAIWLADTLLYPPQSFLTEAHEDMPLDVRSYFLEAASIVDLSPRGAAALLRLAVQSPMPSLGQSGSNLSADIGALVKRGLDPKVQQALDAVRVIGNHAVHPGKIDIKDDKSTAISLFGLINFIIESQVAAPKRINAIYEKLPTEAVAAIAKRDGVGTPAP